jgi:hypothetical protein
MIGGSNTLMEGADKEILLVRRLARLWVAQPLSVPPRSTPQGANASTKVTICPSCPTPVLTLAARTIFENCRNRALPNLC